MIIGALILLVGLFIGYMSRDRRCKKPHQIDFDSSRNFAEDTGFSPTVKKNLQSKNLPTVKAEFLNDNRVAEITKNKKDVTLDDILV